jgi:hypothetical protein
VNSPNSMSASWPDVGIFPFEIPDIAWQDGAAQPLRERLEGPSEPGLGSARQPGRPDDAERFGLPLAF